MNALNLKYVRIGQYNIFRAIANTRNLAIGNILSEWMSAQSFSGILASRITLVS
jgi:hypothetical protein